MYEEDTAGGKEEGRRRRGGGHYRPTDSSMVGTRRMELMKHPISSQPCSSGDGEEEAGRRAPAAELH